jgi:hypothetical protein
MSFSSSGTQFPGDSASLVGVLQQTNMVLTAMLAAYNDATKSADYFHIAGAGTFVVKDAPGTLLSININNIGTGGVGTIYDASGTAGISGTVEIAIPTFGTLAPERLSFGPEDRGLSLNSGLVIVTTGNADITVGFA